MDEPTRWALTLAGLGLASLGAYAHRITIPQYAKTVRPETRPGRWGTLSPFVRQAAKVGGLGGSLAILWLLLWWQAREGIPPQPLEIQWDQPTISLGGAFMVAAIVVMQLVHREGTDTPDHALKRALDSWLDKVAPGLVDGGSRLPTSVYVNEAMEWELLVQTHDAQAPATSIAATLTCGTILSRSEGQRPILWRLDEISGARTGIARWNLSFPHAGTNEVTIELTPSQSLSSFRRIVHVRSVLNLTARQLAIVSLLSVAIGLAADLAGLL